jgi:glutamate carboxypeptidase
VDRIVIRPTLDGVTGELRRAAFHPPMERTPGNARMADLAISIAAEVGFELRDCLTGGASDANTTTAAGLPTLDGLGPVGGDDHSADEWLDLSSVVPRTTLLAALIDRVGEAI